MPSKGALSNPAAAVSRVSTRMVFQSISLGAMSHRTIARRISRTKPAELQFLQRNVIATRRASRGHGGCYLPTWKPTTKDLKDLTDKRQNQLESLLNLPSSPSERDKQRIYHRFTTLKQVPLPNTTGSARLGKLIKVVAKSDLTSADVPREIIRRFFHGSSVSPQSRYSENSRYSSTAATANTVVTVSTVATSRIARPGSRIYLLRSEWPFGHK